MRALSGDPGVSPHVDVRRIRDIRNFIFILRLVETENNQKEGKTPRLQRKVVSCLYHVWMNLIYMA